MSYFAPTGTGEHRRCEIKSFKEIKKEMAQKSVQNLEKHLEKLRKKPMSFSEIEEIITPDYVNSWLVAYQEYNNLSIPAITLNEDLEKRNIIQPNQTIERQISNIEDVILVFHNAVSNVSEKKYKDFRLLIDPSSYDPEMGYVIYCLVNDITLFPELGDKTLVKHNKLMLVWDRLIKNTLRLYKELEKEKIERKKELRKKLGE